MRPFDHTPPSPGATGKSPSVARADTAPHWNSFRFGNDLIGAVVVFTATFAAVWLFAMLAAVLYLTR